MSASRVELNSWVFDGATADDDDILYSWQTLAGWWETAAMNLQTHPRGADDGVVIVDERLNERPIALQGLIHKAAKEDPVGDAGHQALRRLKLACRPLRSLQLLKVQEPGITEGPDELQAYVRLASPMAVDMIHESGTLVTVKFTIPLIAPDPRRYSASISEENHTSPGATVTNNGDELTPPRFMITGPATDPRIRSGSVPTNPILKWEGTVPGGDVLIIDCKEKTVTLEGVNARDGLVQPNWFQLIPGDNVLELDQDTTVEWRDAYS